MSTKASLRNGQGRSKELQYPFDCCGACLAAAQWPPTTVAIVVFVMLVIRAPYTDGFEGGSGAEWHFSTSSAKGCTSCAVCVGPGPRVSLIFPPFRRRVEFMLVSAAQFGFGYPAGMANNIRLPSNQRGVRAVRIGDPRDACATAQTGVRVATTLRRRSGR